MVRWKEGGWVSGRRVGGEGGRNARVVGRVGEGWVGRWLYIL